MSGLLFLLGEIGLALLLAIIAGWYVGWSWRGFRERDRVEDLRRMLRATEEVKDRELTEAYHRIASLESHIEQHQRREERLERDLQEAQATVRSSAASTTEPEMLPAIGELHERLAESEARLDGESSRRREAEAALRDKAGAILALQAELQSLRQAAGLRAAEMVRLEARVVELEGQTRSDAPVDDEAREAARAEVLAARTERDEAVQQTGNLQREIDALRGEVNARDRRINELRVRYQDVANQLEEARARPAPTDSSATAAAGSELGDLRRLLQRQVERNRKQEALHRAVVANLQAEIRSGLGHAGIVAAAPEAAVDSADDEGPSLRASGDDLTRIHGIGPKLAGRLADLGIHTFAQIAAWTEDDIDRVTQQLGDLTDRIRRDSWVDSAREQLRGKYGSIPWR